MRLNLPATSIRDLVVHDDDIVVGTHGRSFWILDNITPLRQLVPRWWSREAHLFTPQLTYRVRRNNNTDTPIPPEEPAGRKSSRWGDDRFLLRSPASGPAVVEITDEAGKLVRRFFPAPIRPKLWTRSS